MFKSKSRKGVGDTVVYGAAKTLMVPAISVTSSRPSGRNLMTVGRSKPVARISLRNELAFDTFTVTADDRREFPLVSYARAVSEWAPLLMVRVSHVSA